MWGFAFLCKCYLVSPVCTASESDCHLFLRRFNSTVFFFYNVACCCFRLLHPGGGRQLPCHHVHSRRARFFVTVVVFFLLKRKFEFGVFCKDLAQNTLFPKNMCTNSFLSFWSSFSPHLWRSFMTFCYYDIINFIQRARKAP